jgi:hypothetical protein
MVVNKIDAALGELQPLGASAVLVAQVCENPSASALEPNALVRGEASAGLVNAGINAAVLAVNTVLEPEIDATVQLVLIELSVVLKFYFFHDSVSFLDQSFFKFRNVTFFFSIIQF